MENDGLIHDATPASTHVVRLKKLYELSMLLSGEPVEIFEHAARMIGELMDVNVVCLSEVRGDELYFLSVYVRGRIYRDVGKCPLEITPCATVESSKDFRIYDDVMAKFPEAAFLKDHNAYSYCGFPALDNQGKVVSVTCLLDDRPHEFTEDDHDILRMFGQRIGMEIERQKYLKEKAAADEELRRHRDELEALVEARTRELKLAQEELLRSERLATVGKLTASVSHELRNPLGTIRSSVYTIATRLEGHAEGLRVDRALARVQRNVTRCDRIIEELLGFTRDKVIRPSTLQVDGWLGEFLAETTFPDGVELETDFSAACALVFDPELLRQAVNNVVENACDAVSAAEAGEVRRVTVSTLQGADGVRIQVSDNGPGMSAEAVGRIFEPLYSSKSFGVGLGMSIVKQIVEAHQGHVEVSSREHEGTQVAFILPGVVDGESLARASS